MAKLSKAHREAISAGLLEYYKGKKKPSALKRLAGSVLRGTRSVQRKMSVDSKIRSKKKQLDQLYLDLRKYHPGSPEHVPHLEKINKVARSLKRMQENRKAMK